MILTEKEIATLNLFNGKKIKYEYVEVKALCPGGGFKLVNKIVKINAKPKKENPVMKMALSGRELSVNEIEDIRLASRKRQSINL